jgi:hypothetical protein
MELRYDMEQDLLDQYNDQVQTEFRLEEIFGALERAEPLDDEEIALLRHSCGMPKKTIQEIKAEAQRKLLLNVFMNATNNLIKDKK